MTALLQPAGKLENFFITMNGLKNEPTEEETVKVFEENDVILRSQP